MSEYTNGPTDTQTPPSTGPKRLVRTRKGRIVAGVCTGASEYTGLDVNIIRIALIVLSFLGGLGAIVYLAGWALLPEEDESTSIAEQFIEKQRSKQS